MKKRNLIILIGSLVALASSIAVLAVFLFHRVVDGKANTGTIEASEMYFGDYSSEEIGYLDAYGKSITCYATEKKGYSGETDDIYLNQLSLKFTYETTMAVYVRIHIQDAWISTKTYTNGNVNKSYIEKDKIDDTKSPFEPAGTDWIYDESTNCIYLKQMVTLAEGEESAIKTHEFRLDDTYFYKTENSTSYREHVTVQVSYFVDIVQANRAEKKWQVSFEELGIE